MRNRQERIEAYLTGRLSESEQAAFQTELLFDRELQREVKATRELQRTLRARSGEAPPARRRWWWLLPVLALAGLLGWWLMDTGSETTFESATDVGPSSEVVVPSDSLSNGGELRVDPLPGGGTKQDTMVRPPSLDPADPTPETNDRKPNLREPIAAFQPNPEVEAAAVNLRGSLYDLELLTAPSPQISLSDSEPITLRFGGRIVTEGGLPPLQLILLSNRAEDYRNRRYLQSVPLGGSAATEGFVFKQQIQIDLQPGRYYWMLEDQDEEVIVRVGWFELVRE